MNEDKEINLDIIVYRLDSLETSINKLTDLLTTVPVLINKFDSFTAEFKSELKRIEQNAKEDNNTLEEMIENKSTQRDSTLRTEIYSRQQFAEKRITDLEETNSKLNIRFKEFEERLNLVEQAPNKKMAIRINNIIDIAFKTLVTIAVTYFLYKIGIKPA